MAEENDKVIIRLQDITRIYKIGAESIRALNGVDLEVRENEYVAVHINQLVEAFKAGLGRYLEEISKEPKRVEKLADRTGTWFVSLDPTVVDKVLALRRE